MFSPRVHVITLHLNKPELTALCLRSLRESTHKNHEVVLIDNGTTDGSGAALKRDFPEITYIRSEVNLGFTGGNNLGMEYSLREKADYIIALNNDTEVKPECIERLVAAAEAHPEAGILNPKILYHDPPGLIWYGGGEHSLWRGHTQHLGYNEMDEGQCDAAREVTFCSGCALFARREVLEQVGLFDDRLFIYAEDTDLCLRAAAKGWRMWYEPSAVVIHCEPVRRRKTVSDVWRLRMSTRNLFQVEARNGQPWHWITAYPWLMTRWVAYLTVKNLALGFPRDALAIWAGLGDWLRGRTGCAPR